ncbi:MAG TPA: biosynthetic peptidoglycan transglycosylase [Polyangiaceae bacterium]
MRSFHELIQSPRALRALVAGGGALGLLLIGLLAAPGVVRAKVEAQAQARGLVAEVGSVGVGSAGVWLHQVRVTSPGDDAELRLDAVNIRLWSGAVSASGGSLRGSGDAERLLRKVRGPASAAGGAERGEGRELRLEGLYVRWLGEPARVEAFGVRASRTASELWASADLGRLASERLSIDARGLYLGGSGSQGRRRLGRLESTALELSWRDGEKALPSSEHGPSAPREPSAPDSTASPGWSTRLRELRALVAPLVREGLANDAQLALDGVSARVQRSGETLSFGPSRLSVRREADAVRITLTPSATEAGVTPLALNALVPLTSGSVHALVKGGPVSLSSLGVRVGQLGLRDVRQATLGADGTADFSEDFETVTIDGKLALRGVVVERKELSPEPVGPASFDLALKGSARLDGSVFEVSTGEAHIGELRAELSGRLEEVNERRYLEGRLRVPLSGCQSVLAAMPRGLMPLLKDVKLSGSFGIDLQVRYDKQAPKDTKALLAVQNECRVENVPAELAPQKFAHPFLRTVKAPDGSPLTIDSGPGTSTWVSIDDMSHHLETAVLICEDSRFHAHGGFDFRALEDAIKDDLKAGRFVRGASTVSMQLAKNLYLGQEKTLGRKLQEALLTLLLEQQLDKRRILELYLNVVELGPGLYGVGDAAEYYFATPARALTLGQSLYLASILPNPSFSRFGADGKLNARWLDYLHRLMHIAHKIKRIDEVELQAALEEEIAFRQPGSAGPTLPASDADAPPELEESTPEPR